MFRFLAILILLSGVFYGLAWLRQLPAEPIRRATKKILFAALLVAVIVMALAGRVYWFGALLTALIPFAKPLLALALRLLPGWQHKQQNNRHRRAPNPRHSTMALTEALQTLGLEAAYRANTLDKKQLDSAHRRLMQKLHPDRGGNDYLAAKVNEAKAVVSQYLQD